MEDKLQRKKAFLMVCGLLAQLEDLLGIDRVKALFLEPSVRVGPLGPHEVRLRPPESGKAVRVNLMANTVVAEWPGGFSVRQLLVLNETIDRGSTRDPRQ